jgi:hypothetical protein
LLDRANVYPAFAMNKRGLFVSLVLAVVGIIMLVLYQQRFVAEASGGEKIKLLFAAKPIEHGKVVTEEMLAVREVPMAYVEDRAVKEVEKAKVLGLQVNDTIQAQQTLRPSRRSCGRTSSRPTKVERTSARWFSPAAAP